MAAVFPRSAAGRSLRVLWLIDSLAMGGAERLVGVFARSCRGTGVALQVACLKTIGGNPVQHDVEASGAPLTHLHAHHLRDLSAFGRLLHLVRREEIDVIHAHLTYASIWAALISRVTGVPAITSMHVGPIADSWRSHNKIRERLMCALVRRWAAKVVMVSPAIAPAWIAGGRFDPSQVKVIRNGVELERFHRYAENRRRAWRRQFGWPDAATVIVTIATLRADKAIDVLLRAIPRIVSVVPDARFLIAGDGPLRRELQLQARRLGCEPYILWAGVRDEVPEMLAAADLFVLPSIRDPWPTVILEAMAAGLPIVASRVDGIPDMLGDGAAPAGRLFAAGDHEGLARAVVELAHDPALAGALGVAARQRATSCYSGQAWANALVAVYRDVLEAKAA